MTGELLGMGEVKKPKRAMKAADIKVSAAEQHKCI